MGESKKCVGVPPHGPKDSDKSCRWADTLETMIKLSVTLHTKTFEDRTGHIYFLWIDISYYGGKTFIFLVSTNERMQRIKLEIMRIGNVKGCLSKNQKDVSHVTAAHSPLILSAGHVDIPFIWIPVTQRTLCLFKNAVGQATLVSFDKNINGLHPVFFSLNHDLTPRHRFNQRKKYNLAAVYIAPCIPRISFRLLSCLIWSLSPFSMPPSFHPYISLTFPQVNLGFLLNIIRVLVMKLRETHTNEAKKVR